MSKVKMIYGAYGYVIGTAERVEQMAKCACCNGLQDESQIKRKVTLLFDREALLYDIANIGYVEGDVMNTDSPHDKHQVIDITEDGNVDRVTRVLDLAHSICVESLYPFTKDECEDGMELDDMFQETPTYKIELNVPKKFSATTAKYLEQLIHEFFVASALADWFSITNPKSADKWAAKAEAVLEEVKRKLHARLGVLTRPLKPF